MISPSPTQPSTGQVVPAQQPEADRRGIAPSPAPGKPEPKRRGSVLKAILRPILKVLYYTIKWIRAHKIAALLATLLLLASIFVTTYVRTGNMPLVSSPNSVRDSIQSNPQLSDDVRNWLLALRSGNIDTMLSIQKSINRSTRPPDSALYVLQFSEPR